MMMKTSTKVDSDWGYKYDIRCPVNKKHRNKIAKIMRKKGYNPQDIEFRSTGMRYAYWKPVKCISEISKITPISEDDFGDSDCGDLFYYEWS